MTTEEFSEETASKLVEILDLLNKKQRAATDEQEKERIQQAKAVAQEALQRQQKLAVKESRESSRR